MWLFVLIVQQFARQYTPDSDTEYVVPQTNPALASGNRPGKLTKIIVIAVINNI